jgi:nicotinamidase-related amidase
MDVKNLTEIDQSTFTQICQQIFQNSVDGIDQDFINLFHQFDSKSKDNRLIDEEVFLFRNWIENLRRPVRSALIIVDVQNDFIDGSLSIDRGPANQKSREIIPIINRLLADIKFDLLVYTLDWHPENHISFFDNLPLRKLIDSDAARTVKLFDQVTFSEPTLTDQKLWPRHCVQNTAGSELHPDLILVENSIKIFKGQNPDIDSYSAFFDNKKLNPTGLDVELKRKNITRIFVCGLAYDVCVADTCYDALDLGYETVLLKDCSRGLDSIAMDNVNSEIERRNGLVVDSDIIKNLLNSSDPIPFAFGKVAFGKLSL